MTTTNQPTNQPIISFIIPIYNTEKYLVECIESILKQSLSKEIILVNDGSTDNSLYIALEYCKQYDFIILIHSNNNGLSSARNKGISLAKGKYIFFIDSDDFILNDDLESICTTADQYNIDIIRLQAQRTFEYLDNNSINLIPSATPNIQRNQGVIFNGYEYFLAIVKEWIPGVCWSIIRRDFILNHNLRFFEGANAEDQLFYIQLITCTPNLKVLEVGNIIYNYRRRNNSIVSTPNAKYFLDHLIICELLSNWSNNHNFPEQIKQAINIPIAGNYNTAIGIYIKLPKEEQEKYKHYITQAMIDFIKQTQEYYKKVILSN